MDQRGIVFDRGQEDDRRHSNVGNGRKPVHLNHAGGHEQ